MGGGKGELYANTIQDHAQFPCLCNPNIFEITSACDMYSKSSKLWAGNLPTEVTHAGESIHAHTNPVHKPLTGGA